MNQSEEVDAQLAELTRAYVAPPKSFIKAIDKTVYHYTDRVGLAGIFSSAEFWATDVLFLNDAAEIGYGRQVVDEALTRRLAGPYGPQLREIHEQYAKFTHGYSICVLCFSEVFDDLSQWRAYSHGGGYALALPPDCARQFGDRNGTFLFPVCYDVSVQNASADALVRELEDRLALFDRSKWNPESVSKATNAFVAAAISLAISVKHPKFKEEKEWRCTFLVPPKELRFRARKSMIVPYCGVALDPGGEILTRCQIVVGPTAHPALARRAAGQMLARYQTSGDPWTTDQRVVSSAIPYRDW